jgi:hypothetical protein
VSESGSIFSRLDNSTEEEEEEEEEEVVSVGPI